MVSEMLWATALGNVFASVVTPTAAPSCDVPGFAAWGERRSSATAVFDCGTDGTLTGGQVLTRCISVTYDGSTTALGVKLYASVSAGPVSALTSST
jgi:hypothetical protein